jgi:hypothetical protein
VGPESTTALMTGAALAAVTVPGESSQDTAALLALAVGAVCLLAWAGGLGFLADPALQAGAGGLHGRDRRPDDPVAHIFPSLPTALEAFRAATGRP